MTKLEEIRARHAEFHEALDHPDETNDDIAYLLDEIERLEQSEADRVQKNARLTRDVKQLLKEQQDLMARNNDLRVRAEVAEEDLATWKRHVS